jgi:hypothetical protein
MGLQWREERATLLLGMESGVKVERARGGSARKLSGEGARLVADVRCQHSPNLASATTLPSYSR